MPDTHVNTLITHRVLGNVMSNDWSVHFIRPDGYGYLVDGADEVLPILKWGDVSADDLTEHERNLRRWDVVLGPIATE